LAPCHRWISLSLHPYNFETSVELIGAPYACRSNATNSFSMSASVRPRCLARKVAHRVKNFSGVDICCTHTFYEICHLPR
jgi:hypothetical protein